MMVRRSQYLQEIVIDNVVCSSAMIQLLVGPSPLVSSNATKVEAAAGAALNKLGEIPLNNAPLLISFILS
jgi:hypothetical protein